MDKLKSFIRLDYFTVKPYFTGKNILILVAVALFMTITSGSISSCIFVGMMIGTLLFSYPFVVGEKSNMDALYVTLSINRKTVVSGRYVFTFLLNVFVVLIVVIIASIWLLAARITGIGGAGSGDALWTAVLLAALFAVVQAIQLPVYFKYSYAKAKFLCLVPFAAIMAGFIAFITIAGDGILIKSAIGFIESINASWLIVCVVLALALVMLASYKLSLSFYKKREF